MREMKDSGVKWIGEIPEDWSVVRMKNCILIRNGGAWGEEKKNSDGDIICLRIADFDYSHLVIKDTTDLTIRNYDKKQIKKLRLIKGDILIEKSGGGDNTPVGRAVIFDKQYEALFANFMDRLRVKECIIPRYFLYLLSTLYDNRYIVTYIKQTTGLQNLDLSSMLSKESVPLPEIKQQFCITEYLDRKCSQIDSIIKRQEQIVEKLNIYKTALITEAVTRGVNPCRNTKKTNIGWISEIPSHWTEYRVANLYDQTNESGEESLPILTVSINSGISDRELKDDEQERVFVRSEDRTKYKRVRPGDLVYNMMRAWQGAFGAVRVNGMVSPAYVTCRPKKNTQIDSRYIEYLFRTPVAVEEMHRYSHGIADFRLRLYWPEFKNIRLCIPPTQEQTEIADYIDEKCLLIDKLIEKRERLIKKMEGYKKSLIYECVTGKKEISVHIKDAYVTGIKPKVLEQICDQAKSCGIHKVILFGSRARGTFHRDSDIDLAVSGGNIDFFRLAVEEETDTLLAYDVVNLDRTSNEELLDVIRKEGVIIYEEV